MFACASTYKLSWARDSAHSTEWTCFSWSAITSTLSENHFTVLGPVTRLCGLKCQIFLDSCISPALDSTTLVLMGNCLFNWRNHSFKAQWQTKRSKSLVWAQATHKHLYTPSISYQVSYKHYTWSTLNRCKGIAQGPFGSDSKTKVLIILMLVAWLGCSGVKHGVAEKMQDSCGEKLKQIQL